jgi:hypothetical protein
MSFNGLTIKLSTFNATLFISESSFGFICINDPLPSIRESFDLKDLRAAPNIRFSPAWVFNKAIF